MAWFDAPKMNYPKTWSEYSFDSKLFFVWEGSLMALIITGSAGLLKALDDVTVYCGLAAYALVLAGLSVSNHNRNGWHWPRPDTATLFKSAGTAILMAVFLFVFLQGLLSQPRQNMPMILFAISIGVFNVLSSLKLVQMSESDFQALCGGAAQQPEPAAPVDPRWKRMVRAAYMGLFLVTWLEGMATFYLHEKTIKIGALHPTQTQTRTISEHGAVVYVTEKQKRLDDLMLTIMMFGIPSVVLGGFALHFVAGVTLFNNLQPSQGIFPFWKK